MATNRETLLKFINAQSQRVQDDISQQGYKRDSPYVDRPQNVIKGQPGQPTQITMQGVDKTLMGIDEYGNKKIMHPGQEYEFPGSEVTETEIAKNGGTLLTKTITCQNCGWKWKAADGGNDIETCHKCGHENTIMQSGGEKVDYDSPEYAEAYKKGEVQSKALDPNNPDATWWGGVLDDVEVKSNYKKNWLEEYRDKIVDENKDAGVLGAIIGTPISAITSLPQLMGMKALTGKMQRPSEGMDMQNPYGAMAVDAIADPANLIGVGELSGLSKLTKEQALAKLAKIETSIAPELREGLQEQGFSDLFKRKTNVPIKTIEKTIKPVKSNIEFSGPLKHSAEHISDVLQNLKTRGAQWDKAGIPGKDILHPEMMQYHGTYHGRPLVEVKMPDGTSEHFYKSSGWAGKEGAAANGTTEGMWQVYGGHANNSIGNQNIDNWFIKDKDYENYYGSNTFGNMAENMDNALINKYKFKNVDELENAFNFQNRNGNVDSYTPQSYKKQNGGENQDVINWTKKYVSSPKYKERITNAGYDNPDKQIDKRLQNLKNVNIVNANNMQGTVYKPNTNTIETSYPADIEYYDVHKNLYPTKPELNSVIAHELGHSETNRKNSATSLLNERDRKELKNRLLPGSDKDLEVYINGKLKHDKSKHNIIPEENKSDLNSFRYDLRNVYDAGNQDFTEETLNNSPSSFSKERLLKNYSKEDLIWLMNNVAQNNSYNNQMPIAQAGGQKDYEIAMRGMMKSKIGMGNAFGHPSIMRMSQAAPKTGMTPEGIGTHYMSSVDNYAVPLLQDFGEENLRLVNGKTPSAEDIKFNSPEEAEYFAEHYKEVAPMMKHYGKMQAGGSTYQYAPVPITNGDMYNVDLTKEEDGGQQDMPAVKISPELNTIVQLANDNDKIEELMKITGKSKQSIQNSIINIFDNLNNILQ